MNRRSPYHPEQDLVWSVMQAFGKLLLWPFRGLKADMSRNKRLQLSNTDRATIASKWREVRELMQTPGPSHFRLAILHADTALDGALKAFGLTGLTMGERLKNGQTLFKPETYNMIWQAHKVRNRLAHEMESEVMSWEAREAVASFELALREIGVITDDFSAKG